MNAKPIVLKLGGSAITNKKKPMAANHRVIRRLASEIASAKVAPLIVVHGGGSFGHPLAEKYKIKEGYNGSAAQMHGFAETHQAMVTLNKLVVDALIQSKVPAVAVSPSSSVVTKSGRIQTMPEEALRKLLDLGFVPVLYGDAVFDSDLGFTILSGDQLIAALAMRFNADRIIVGLDVKGLHTTDPDDDKKAPLIRHINLKELKERLHRIGKAKVADVTGGMLGKVTELIPAVESGVTVQIVSAKKAENVYKALKGETVRGTLITRE